MTKPYYRQHRTRPCKHKKRKDGAPQFRNGKEKTDSERTGHPPAFSHKFSLRDWPTMVLDAAGLSSQSDNRHARTRTATPASAGFQGILPRAGAAISSTLVSLE